MQLVTGHEPERIAARLAEHDSRAATIEELERALVEERRAVVSARGLARTYGKGDATVHALRDVDIDIPRGGLTAIMGPSGSGKSTLMHILAGLDRPTSGRVEIDGVEITSLKEKRLTQLRRDKVGFIFQSFNLLPTLSADENIALPLALARRHADESWRTTVIEAVGLRDRLAHRPSELSGGQQQRVAVARALISSPAVLFADEPTGNLDSRAGDEVLNLLRRSVDDFGQTVIMVTHDAGAASIADSTVFLKDGRIVFRNGRMSRDEVYDTIKDLEAGMLGEPVSREADALRCVLSGQAITGRAAAQAAAAILSRAASCETDTPRSASQAGDSEGSAR